MSTSREVVLSAERARQLCLQVLEQLEVPAGAAALGAESMVEASLQGVDSHGIALLAIYAERVRSGQIRPGRRWLVRREGPASALCDGQQGFGPALACRAMDLAADKAASSGVGAVSLVDSNYLGALSFYVRRAAARGLIGIAAANSTPRVAPYGGRRGLHGTNPLAYGVPVAGGEPMVFDAATGHAAAPIGQALQAGRLIAAGMALDKEGRPTTDPAAALEGVLLPVGGVMGYGLGLLVDLLCGGLGGTACGPDVPPVTDLQSPYGCSFFALAIDPGFFGGGAVFAERCRFLLDSARQVPPADGGASVRVPGQRAAQTRRQRLEGGIPIGRENWRSLVERLRACQIKGEWHGF